MIKRNILKISNHRFSYKFIDKFKESDIKFHPMSKRIYINGLYYYPNYITKSEEQIIISLIEKNEWMRSINRRQQHYGVTYYHTRHNIPELQPNDKFESDLKLETFDFLVDKFMREGFFEEEKRPNQCLVNEYLNNQFISSHFEDEKAFGETIVSISLISPIYFTMKNPYLNEECKIYLDTNSLLIMKDDARFQWKHGITKMKQIINPDNNKLMVYRDEKYRRISLTFRKVLDGRKRSLVGEKSENAIW